MSDPLSDRPVPDAPGPKTVPANQEHQPSYPAGPSPRDPGSNSGTLSGTLPSSDADNRYELVDEIAHGGMGIVYLAKDRVLGRDVGVKTLLQRPADGGTIARRFCKEARITGQLQHPGIPPVHDLGTLPDKRPFLAMKLIKGRTLAKLLKDRPDPSADRGRFIAIFEQVCQAVAYAHSRHVVHRDLKPSNVMVGAFGEVQVMDWGLAKVLDHDPEEEVTQVEGDHDADGDVTQAGAKLGTPAYWAPEQARGEPADRRSDVFALGGILCVILTGGKTPIAGLDQLDTCGADAELIALAKRCRELRPDARPVDGKAVADAVAEWRSAAEERAKQAELDRVRAEGQRAKADAEARKQRMLRRTQLALAAVVGLSVCGGVVAAWWQDKQMQAKRESLAQNRHEIETAVGQCEGALRNEDAELASVALDRIEKRLPHGGGEQFADRIAHCRIDLALLTELDRVSDLWWTIAEDKFQHTKATVERSGVFQRFRMAPGQGSPREVAQRVRDSLIHDRVLMELDRWLARDRSAELLLILQAADPDRYRSDVRTAIQIQGWDMVLGLVDQPTSADQPAWFAVALAELNEIPLVQRERILGSALRRMPSNFSALMTFATLITTDDPQSAEVRIGRYHAALGLRPKNVAAWNNLGVSLRHKGEIDSAITCYERVFELDRSTAITHHNLGSARAAKYDFDGAILCYREAIRLNPKSMRSHAALVAALDRKGDLDGAVGCAREAVRLNPEHPGSHASLGLTLAIRGNRGDVDEAIALLLERTRLNPEHANSHAYLGFALAKKGDADKAIPCYREAIRLDPKNSFAHNKLGIALVLKREVEEAIASFREAIRIDPKEDTYYTNLGIALRQKGDVEGAIDCYRQAIKFNPQSASAYNNLGSALSRKGDLDGSIAAHQEAVRLNPKHPGFRKNLDLTVKQKADRDAKTAPSPREVKRP